MLVVVVLQGWVAFVKVRLIVQTVLDLFAGLPGDAVVVALRCVARACGCHVAAAGGATLGRAGAVDGGMGCALPYCGGGLAVGPCEVVVACRSAMSVNLLCGRLGRLVLVMGAPIGCGRSCMCFSPLCWVCSRCLCTSRGVPCS